MIQIFGPLTCGRNEVLHGQVVGDVHVPDGSSFTCHGQVTGDLHVAAGGKAKVLGMVCGTIFNAGGDVDVMGAYGAIKDGGALPTTVSAGAMKLG